MKITAATTRKEITQHLDNIGMAYLFARDDVPEIQLTHGGDISSGPLLEHVDDGWLYRWRGAFVLDSFDELDRVAAAYRASA